MPDSATPNSIVIEKPRPALSATSDMPAAAVAEETKTETVETKTDAETKQATGSEAAVKADTSAETVETETKGKKGIGERFSDYAERVRVRDATIERQSADLSKALAAIANLSGKSEAAETIKQAATDDPKPTRPKRDGFDDVNAYDEAIGKHEDALVEWSLRQGERAAKANLEKERLETEQRRESETVSQRWQESHAKFVTDHPDFDEVVFSDNLRVTDTMKQAVLQADNGPALAYHLGKNPQEAARIAACAPARQIFEMGRLAASLQPKPNVSTAPKPITPLKAASSKATEKSPDEETPEEYAARRTEANGGRPIR